MADKPDSSDLIVALDLVSATGNLGISAHTLAAQMGVTTPYAVDILRELISQQLAEYAPGTSPIIRVRAVEGETSI